MSKVPLLLFSGGLDSTYMLQRALEEGDVETLYVKASQGPAKVAKELAQREKIFAKLKRLYPDRQVRRDYVIDVGWNLDGSTPDHMFIQPILWLNAALRVSNGERHSELRIGYVNGDSIMSRLLYIRAAWENIQAFTKWTAIPIAFPLEMTKKMTVLQNIHPRLYHDIWVCEIPKAHGKQHRACGKCEPCITHASLLHAYELKVGRTYRSYNQQMLPSYKLPSVRKPRRDITPSDHQPKLKLELPIRQIRPSLRRL